METHLCAVPASVEALKVPVFELNPVFWTAIVAAVLAMPDIRRSDDFDIGRYTGMSNPDKPFHPI